MKIKLLFLFCLLCGLASAQQFTNYGTITAQSATCPVSYLSTTSACVTLQLSPTSYLGSIVVGGTFSATLQFEVSADGGTTWVAAPGGTSSTTAPGTWTLTVAPYSFLRVRASAYTSGVAVVTLSYSVGNGGNSSGSGISITTVSGLASVPGKKNGTFATVTDGNSATDCTTGGGSTNVNCQYNGSTWAQAVASSSGSTAYSALTGGTNGSAAMVCGTGCSIATSGSGTNAATSLSGNIAESQVTNLTTDLAAKAPLASPTFTGAPTVPGYVPTTTTVNGHALSSNVTVSASDLSTGTLPHAQLPTLLSGDIPNNAANTSGTAANLSGTPALPNGTTATTQTGGDNTAKIATDAFVLANGWTNPMTTLGDSLVGGASGAATRIAGPTGVNGVPQVWTSTPASGLATQQAWAPTGVTPRASTCTSNLDTIVATDRGNYVTWTDASACAVTLPASNSTGFASNVVLKGCNIGAGTVTITPTTSTISYTLGGAYTSGASSVALTTGQCVVVFSDNTNYFANLTGGGPITIASGTSAMGTGAITSGTCATVVTTTATGAATTDNLIANPTVDPTGVTGYAVSATGSLYIQSYITSGNVNFKVCNNTSGSLTPSALTMQWRVIR